MKRSTRLIVAIVFPLVLITPPASVLLPIEPVEIENRSLQRPDITLRNLTDPSFVREVLSYARLANPMRTLLIRVGAGLDFWVFDDSPDPTRVLKGTDDWLYYRPTFEEPCTAPPERVAANIVSFITRLERDVPTVVLTVAPSKLIIHPEHLTPDQVEMLKYDNVVSDEAKRRAIVDEQPRHAEPLAEISGVEENPNQDGNRDRRPRAERPPVEHERRIEVAERFDQRTELVRLARPEPAEARLVAVAGLLPDDESAGRGGQRGDAHQLAEQVFQPAAARRLAPAGV